MGEPPKKDYPPGWNDPPMLNYSPVNPPPKSRITNKRVAFPVESQRNPQNVNPSLPPPVLNTNNVCSESIYLKASENFNTALENFGNERIKEEIWQMLSAWQRGQFSDGTQELLFEISNCILEKNRTKLKELHLKLMMGESCVKSYLPALSNVINNL
ncbi:uncharacterized protein LOC143197452 isoform X1 [Rhynchophorus ferrugineus]|uniref:uncharacterized protein LOC143197452 isoform X1 n=1 Tax=Rhynchophorus ferrugineus TaxID=354439 RepID=UPI003FCE7238